MRSKDQLKEAIPKTGLKSKVKMIGLFDDLLEKTIENLVDYLDPKLEDLYDTVDIDIWKKGFKIKIEDTDKFILKNIDCVFDNTKVDEKYGNFRIELTFKELSKKPRYALVGKFNLKDQAKINDHTFRYLVRGIDEIFE